MPLDRISAEVGTAALHEAVDAMPTAFAMYDDQLTLQACNQTYARYHRQDRAELLGQSLQNIIENVSRFLASMDGAPVPEAGRMMDAVFANPDQLAGNSHEIGTVDGDWYLTSFHPTESGGLVSTWVEITDQKKLENNARETQERLEDAINSTPNIFALYDGDGKMVICNQAYADYQHKSIDALIGSHHDENVANSHQYIARVNDAAIVSSPEDYVEFVEPRPGNLNNDREIETHDGRTILASDRITGHGGIVFVARDITPLKRGQRRFEDAIEAMPAAFSLFNKENILLACNTAYAEFHRRPREELLGLKADEIGARTIGFVKSFDGEPVFDRDATHQRVLKRISNPRGQSWEIGTDDGKWHLTGYHAAQDGGFVSVSTDVTDYKILQDALRLNQSRMDEALEAMSDVFALYDDEHKLVACNSAYERFTNLSREQAIGRRIDELVDNLTANVSEVHDSDIPYEPGRYFETMKKHAEESSISVELETATGEIFQANDWRTPTGGQIFLARDITSLKREQRRFVDAIEAMPHSFCLWDADLKLVTCNTSFARYFGRTKQAISGKSAKSLCAYLFRLIDHPVDLFGSQTPEDAAGLLEWFREPKDQNGEFVGRDGRHFRFTVSPAADGGAVCTARDISDLRQAEQDLQKQQEALMQSEKMSALGTMLAGVAHELNNPLSVVVGQTLLMKETAADDKIQRRAEMIGNAADRCGRIVKSFLAMARQNPPDSQSVDLNEIVDDTLEVSKYTLGQSSIYVEDDLASDLPMVWGDPDQLGQIILNLVINAQHALESVEGERRIKIETQWETATSSVVLRVSDNGPGVPDDLRNRIFEPFFTTKDAGSGTGLGLALTRKIIDSHGGSISLGDVSSAGCSFVVRLPAQIGGKRPVAEDEIRPAADGCHILIVDDETDVITTLRDILEVDGHTVVTASSGAQALERLAEQRFDLMLTDLRMQDTDGMELYRQVGIAYPELAVRVGFVTGDTLSTDVREFLMDADRPVLEKPFRPDDVRSLIGELTAS